MKRAVFILFVSLTTLGVLAPGGRVHANPAAVSSPSPKNLELLAMIRTAPLEELSRALQSAAFLSDSQSQKLLMLMHLFLGRLGFPEFEVFDSSTDTGSFFFKNEAQKFSKVTLLRFDADRIKEDPNLPELYQGLFAQMRLLSKSFQGYVLVSEDQEVLDYFSEPVRLRRLQRILRHEPHRYCIEATAFKPLLVGPLEFSRKSLLQFIDVGRDKDGMEEGVDFLASIVQVLLEEAKTIDTLHLGLSLDDQRARLGLMSKVAPSSDLGGYLKAPIADCGVSPGRYVESGTLSYIKRWNNTAFALYQDKLFDRLEAYSPPSKRYLWSRSASLAHEFNQSVHGAYAGSVGFHYERLSADVFLGSTVPMDEGLGLFSCQSVWAASGLQASSTGALLGFLVNSLARELRGTLQEVLRLNSSGAAQAFLASKGLPSVWPLFDFKLQLDTDIYLERPVHVLTSSFYDKGADGVLRGQSHDYIGVLAQGIAITNEESALRPLMKRVKSNQAAEKPVEALFEPNPKKMFDLSFDIKTCLSSLLEHSPVFSEGPYALSERNRLSSIEQLRNAFRLSPLRMSIEKEKSLIDAYLTLDTESLRTLVNFSEDFSKNLFKR